MYTGTYLIIVLNVAKVTEYISLSIYLALIILCCGSVISENEFH